MLSATAERVIKERGAADNTVAILFFSCCRDRANVQLFSASASSRHFPGWHVRHL
jgi:hypothetical protein